MSFKTKLRRYASHLNDTAENSHIQKGRTNSGAFSLNKDRWEKYDCTFSEFAGQTAIVRTKIYPLVHQHGVYRFDQLESALTDWDSLENATLYLLAA